MTTQTARKIAESVRRRELTAVAVTQAALERIEQLNGTLRAFITVTHDLALAAAAEVDRKIAAGQGKDLTLPGVPLAIKDSFSPDHLPAEPDPWYNSESRGISNTIDRSPAMSTAVATKTQYTPEDLLAMPDGKSYELVHGQLVEREMGIESSWVAGRLLVRLGRFCEKHGIGWALPADSGYQCFPQEPGLVRKPDASFVRYGRFPGGVLPKGWAKIPPDLAVEVVSPNDTTYALDEKLEDYQKAGVPLVWVINPNSRKVRVHRGDGSISDLREDEELSGEDVIPGFRCMVREILPLHEPSQEVQANPNGPKESR